jgi:hypothetical protein
MKWNLEGSRVQGLYIGEFTVSGRVEQSRVRYGGGVSHHIVLDTPVTVYGSLRDRVILEHELIEQVFDNA